MKTISELLDAVFAAESAAWARWDEANAAFGTEREPMAAATYAVACSEFNAAKAALRTDLVVGSWHIVIAT